MVRLELLLKILTIIESDETKIILVNEDSKVLNLKSKSFLSLIYETRSKTSSYLKNLYEYYKLLGSINKLAYELNFDLTRYNNSKFNLRKLKQLEIKLIGMNDKDFDNQFKLA